MTLKRRIEKADKGGLDTEDTDETMKQKELIVRMDKGKATASS